MAISSDGKVAIRLAVVGAGPIGLELALAAVLQGVDVEVFERASTIADHVEAYNFVRLFSPWSLNVTATGTKLLKENGYDLPDEDTFPTGREYIDNYLSPLASVLQKQHHFRGFHFGSNVISVGRGALLKGESIGGGEVQMPKGKPMCEHLRKDTYFRLLVQKDGSERYHEDFNYVADCSGFYREDLSNWIGMGGIPALGERSMRASKRLRTQVPDVLGRDRGQFAGKRSLVVGAGMSAATTVRDILTLSETEPNTEVIFVTRSASAPYTVIADDVLPQRKALCELGNKASRMEVPNLSYHGGVAIHEIKEVSGSRLAVALKGPNHSKAHWEEVDEIVCCVGYHPDTSIYEELQVHQCYGSNGPMKLAATLIGGSGDCLAQVSSGADTLKNPEPGFFILGSKSFGRKSSFLLKIGHEQVRAIVGLIAQQ